MTEKWAEKDIESDTSSESSAGLGGLRKRRIVPLVVGVAAIAIIAAALFLYFTGNGIVLMVSDEPHAEFRESGLSSDEVAMHDSTDDCWVIYYGVVYDMTNYAPRHPGGNRIVTRWCGKDGTEAYDVYHPENLLRTIPDTLIGNVNDAAPLSSITSESGGGDIEGSASSVLTSSEVARHDSTNDCWVIYYGAVYDMTQYAPRHPGGERIITKLCGKDGTKDYAKHHKEKLLRTISETLVGSLNEPASSSTVTTGDRNDDEISESG